MAPLFAIPYDILKIRPYKASPETVKWLIDVGGSSVVIDLGVGRLDKYPSVPCAVCKKTTLAAGYKMVDAERPRKSYAVCRLCLSPDPTLEKDEEYCKDSGMWLGKFSTPSPPADSCLSRSREDGDLSIGDKGYLLGIGNYPARRYLWHYVREIYSIMRHIFNKPWTDDSPSYKDPEGLFHAASMWCRTNLAAVSDLQRYFIPMAIEMHMELKNRIGRDHIELGEEVDISDDEVERYVDRLIGLMAPSPDYQNFLAQR